MEAASVTNLFILLVVYQLKHFLADYPLQGAYMLKKFLGGWQWVLPLAAHAGVHGLFTLAITQFMNPALWWLSLVDFGVHFIMDRIKASPNLLGRYKTLTAEQFKECWSTIQIAKGTRLHLVDKEHVSKDEALRRIKGNTYFWWSLGLDQMVHHLTHYYLIWKLIS